MSGRVRKCLLDPGGRVHHPPRVGVRAVETEEIDVLLDQGGAAIEDIRGHTDPRRHPQATEVVFAGVRIVVGLLDVLDRDEPLEASGLVDDQELFDAVFVEERLRLLEGRPDRRGDQILLGHEVGDRPVELGAETEVAVGEDALELPLGIHHREAGNSISGHDVEGLSHRLFGVDRDRVDDHARLGTLDLVHLFGLVLDRHVLVDDAEPTELGHGDPHVPLGHRVHRRRDDRQVERDATLRQTGRNVHIVGVDLRTPGHQQYVVIGQAYRNVSTHFLPFPCFGGTVAPLVLLSRSTRARIVAPTFG